MSEQLTPEQIRFRAAYVIPALKLTQAVDELSNVNGELAVSRARVAELEAQVAKLTEELAAKDKAEATAV